MTSKGIEGRHATANPSTISFERLAVAAVSTAWLAVLALILSHPLFVTNDSVNNYVHVWYAAERLWHGHGLPFHMPVLGHGDALAFPYGFLPWATAAIVRPLLGDWIVTLWLVGGFLGLVAAVLWTFPELRRGWALVLFLLNPALIEAPLLGQLPFIWAAAFFFLAAGAWRRNRRIWAALALGVAQATHPAVMLPICVVVVAVRLYFEPDRPALLRAYAASLLIALPAAVLVLLSPVVEDTSKRDLLLNFLGTTLQRSVVIVWPFVVIAAMRTPIAARASLLAAALLVVNVAVLPLRQDQFAWGALFRSPDHSLRAFTTSPAFDRGATYRILRVADGKVGMYDLLLAGGRLDSELFPESIDRRSWPDAAQYARFLEKRNVDYVIVYAAYDRRYRTNEHHLLSELRPELLGADGPSLRANLVLRSSDFDVYGIDRGRSTR